jgi:hypothetical protein
MFVLIFDILNPYFYMSLAANYPYFWAWSAAEGMQLN